MDSRFSHDEHERDLVQYLQCYIRQQNQRDKVPLIDKTWRSIAERYRAVSFKERCERLLTLLAERAGHHSRYVKVDPWKDGPQVGEPFTYQFEVMRLHLENEGWIRIPSKCHPEDFYRPNRCGITPDGWLKYEKLRKRKRSLEVESVPEPTPADVSDHAHESQEDRAHRRQKWLEPILRDRGLSRSGLANKAGLDHKVIANYWHGRTQQLSAGSHQKIANTLAVAVAEVPT